MATRCNRWFLLQILLLAQHVSGTTMPITRSSRVLYRWLLPVVFGALVFKLSVWCGAEGYVSGLRACWASNKLCNKNHLLHLVGILYPLGVKFHWLLKWVAVIEQAFGWDLGFATERTVWKILECDAMTCDVTVQTFRRNVPPPSSY